VYLSPVERLILLKLTQILAVIDPANAKQHDADAQALEVGFPAAMVGLFDLIDLEPMEAAPPRPFPRLVSSNDFPTEEPSKETANV
jgi:hypothetical protein